MNTILRHKTQSGFTLLFAVLISSLVISIGATIISIALRQTILSGTSRESQYAFYAANTALECAHYWDTTSDVSLSPGVVFPAPGSGDILIDSSKYDLITCANVNIINGVSGDSDLPPWDIETVDPDTEKTTFYLKIKDESAKNITGELQAYIYCAQATVTKENLGTSIKTRIDAKGYNTCDPDNPRRVERGIEQQY